MSILLFLKKKKKNRVGNLMGEVAREGSTVYLHLWEMLHEKLQADIQLAMGLHNHVKLGFRRKAITTMIQAHIKVCFCYCYCYYWDLLY